MRIAEQGILELEKEVDAIIVIPNDKLLAITDKDTNFKTAFAMCDQVISQAVEGISDLITTPGIINVDFADVKTILHDAGPAWLAIGRGKGDNRAVDAAKMATRSPLLDIAMEGAKRILFVITGGASLTLQEVQDAARVIEEMSDPEANIIFGTSRDPRLDDEVKMTMVAASFPVMQDTQQMREAELQRLLQDITPEIEEELDVPSFLRHQSGTRRGGGLFR